MVLPSFGTETDSTQFEIQQSDAHPKSGWSFGGIPALAYDSDLGFLYGAILEVWDYGNGTKYRITSYNVCYTKLLRARPKFR